MSTAFTQERFCDHCGAANPLDATQCWHCQAPLTPPEAGVGTLLIGRYQLIRELGQGGMGTVFLGEDRRLGARPVAVKCLSKHRLNAQERAEAERAFQQEAELLARLHHPSLPAIHDYWSEPEASYLVMDYIEGETLEAIQQRTPQHRLPLEQVVEWGEQLCEVLAYLHEQQPPVIFRDLKPANVMVRQRDGRLLLIDFGIARHFKAGQAHDTMAFGSPGFAAPEQYGKEQTTPRSDLYSLGAVLHSLLSGRDPSEQPFRFAPLRQLNPEVPEELARLIAELVALEPKQRPSSAREVLERLKRQPGIGKGSGRSARVGGWPAQGQGAAAAQPKQGLAPTVPAGPFVSSAGQTQAGRQGAAAAQPKQGLAPTVPAGPFVSSAGQAQAGRQGAAAAQPKQGLAPTVPAGPFVSLPGQAQAGRQRQLLQPALISPPAVPIQKPQISRRSLLALGLGAGALALTCGGVVFIASQSRTIDLATQEAQGSENVSLLITCRGHQGPVTALAWSPDHVILASASRDQTVRLWDVRTGASLLVYTGHQSEVQALSWSPWGVYIASGSADGFIHIWDADTGQLQRSYQGHKGAVNALAWSPQSDSVRLASAGDDGSVSIWDGLSGALLWNQLGDSGSIRTLAWSPDGKRLASAGDAGLIEIRETVGWSTLSSYQGHSDPVWSLAWSPDGNLLASGSADTTVRIWNLSLGERLLTYKGHSDRVTGLAWSPFQSKIASCSDDGTLQLWDGTSGQLWGTGKSAAFQALVWWPSYTQLATGDKGANVRIWQTV
ncbi:WD40 repeat domain-containing serine/threonine-protein kinase [Thermogemmatispora carboxidivorans]|uniref:WD40 repeat domain-containing serine/threonine-protein kinase n=1 Tax=Thermogemmatispora carboxidivorans TaxID=1382306 RepID=UPI00069976D0|nr:WD40 repeat domain-containing serine/threonine-protein kinase [Thermogemmatispora carboxidivorans]